MIEARLRQAKMRDLALIERFHREQNERDGTNYPLPRLFDGKVIPKVPVALAVEDAAGYVIGSLYVDTAPELCFAGCDPKATAVARRDIEGLAYLLRCQGFSHLRTLIPRVALEGVRRPLEWAGFRERDDLAIFSRSLMEPEGETNEP